MGKYLQLFIFVLTICFAKKSSAQCSTSTFSIQDSVCPTNILNIDNSLSTAISYNWDFCLGDLDSIPTGILLGNINGALGYPQAMKLVYENGNYYGFITNIFDQFITRYEFGNNLSNIPTVSKLTVNSLLSGLATGIDMVKENSDWYMFVVLYSSNTMIRIKLDSITDLNPVYTNLNPTGLSNPRSVKIIDGHAFICSGGTPEIARLNFNGSYNNLPTQLNPGINTGMFSNFGIDIAYDCQINKYIGYVTNVSNNKILKIDFGSSLGNIAIVSNTAGNISSGQGITIAKEGSNWKIFATSNGHKLYSYHVGQDLDQTVNDQWNTSLGGIMVDPINIQLTKSGSSWKGLIPNNLLNSLLLIEFPQGCNSNNISSDLQSPNNISFTSLDTGIVDYELIETYSNDSTQQFTGSIVNTIFLPEVNFSHSTACTDLSVQFSDSSTICYGTISQWNWDFDNGQTSTLQNPSTAYSSPGTYNVVLTVTSSDNIVNSISKTITVYNNPTAAFIVTDTACVNANIIASDNSTSIDGTVNSWLWDLGNMQTANGNSTSTNYLTSSTYTIQLIVSTDLGCKDTTTNQIYIEPGPIANFTTYNTCIDEVANFSNLTSAVGVNISSYDWNFGDSNTSNDTDPLHDYTNSPNNYIVTLVANATNGCSDTYQRTIRIGNKPNTNFILSKDTVCTNEIFTITDNSSAGSGDTLINRYWNLGDGHIDSTITSLSYSYNTAGTYTITLRAINATDCDSTTTKSIVVIGSPVADFNYSYACLNTPNTLTDLSTTQTGTNINSWLWNYGDGNTSTTQNNSYTYNNPGQYNITLTVTNDIGCIDSLTETVIVFHLPEVNFGFGHACTNAPVLFSDSSTVINSTIFSLLWTTNNFNDSSTISQPSFIFTNSLAYPVTLIATSDDGCIDSTTKIITVDQTPEFNIIAGDHCFGKNQNFTFQLNKSASQNLAYLWNFGDSTASFISNPNHQYGYTNNFNVELQITDLDNTCTGTTTDTIAVNPLPVASFMHNDVCIGQTAIFTDNSTVASGQISNWQWIINNDTLNGSTQNILETIVGNYTIKEIVTTDKGCTSTKTDTLSIYPLPTVQFTSNPTFGAPPLIVQFNNTSSTGNYDWNFGVNGSNSTQSNPTYTYSDTGHFVVGLVVTNQNGCIDSIHHDIVVMIPDIDLAIKGASFTKSNGEWTMKVNIANEGNLTATNFTINAKLDGKSNFIQRFEETNLLPGQLREFTFSTKFIADQIEPEYFCTEITEVNDTIDFNASNNKFCSIITKSFEILSAYPNPFKNIFFLNLNMPKGGDVSINVYDGIGQLVKSNMMFQCNKGINNIQISAKELNSGLYIVTVGNNESEINLKLIKD